MVNRSRPMKDFNDSIYLVNSNHPSEKWKHESFLIRDNRRSFSSTCNSSTFAPFIGNIVAYDDISYQTLLVSFRNTMLMVHVSDQYEKIENTNVFINLVFVYFDILYSPISLSIWPLPQLSKQSFFLFLGRSHHDLMTWCARPHVYITFSFFIDVFH